MSPHAGVGSCGPTPRNDSAASARIADPIAMVPNRDTLFIAGSDDPEGLEMMADLTEKSLEEPRPMMSTALRLDGDEWVDWLPPANHPAHRRFKLMKLYCQVIYRGLH